MLFRKLGVFQIQVVACIILQAVGCGGGSSETSQGFPDQGAEAINMLQLPPYVKFDIKLKRYVRSSRREADMILIPGGEFFMGSSDFMSEQISSAYSMTFWDEMPQHIVNLEAFYIDKYEVTNTEYSLYLKDPGLGPVQEPKFWKNPKFNHPAQPVIGVTWQEAFDYAQSYGKRLLSEAEWEKAASWSGEGKGRLDSGYARVYPWGNTFSDERLNYNANRDGPTKVGQFPLGESRYGVQDMAGNVSEWVRDVYNKEIYQSQSSVTAILKANEENATRFNEQGFEDSAGFEHRVHRGGKWNSWKLKELDVRCARRLHAVRGTQDPGIGFRCAVDAKVVYNDISTLRSPTEIIE